MSKVMETIRQIGLDTEVTTLRSAWQQAISNESIQDAAALQIHLGQLQSAHNEAERALIAAENTKDEPVKKLEYEHAAQALADFFKRQLEANGIQK